MAITYLMYMLEQPSKKFKMQGMFLALYIVWTSGDKKVRQDPKI